MSSTRAMAISAATRTERRRAWPLPVVPVRPVSFRVPLTLVWMAAKAGASPQSRPVSNASARAKAITGQLRPIS